VADKSNKPQSASNSAKGADRSRVTGVGPSGDDVSNAVMIEWLNKEGHFDPTATKTTGDTEASYDEFTLGIFQDAGLAPTISQRNIEKNKTASQQWTDNRSSLGVSADGVAVDGSWGDVNKVGHGRRDKPDGRDFTTTRNATTAGAQFNGVDDWKLNLGNSTETEVRNEKKGQESTNSSHSSNKGISVGSDGVGFNAGRSSTSASGAKTKATGEVTVGDHKVGAGGGIQHTSAGGTKASANVSGSVTYNKPTPREIDGQSSGLDATIRDVAGGDVTATGRTNGASIAGSVGIGKGAFGVSASGHAATESGVHFHTNDSITDKGNVEDRHASRLPDGASLSELDLAGLDSGEGYSMQHTGSVGAGLGVVIYGVGAGGSFSSTDVQQTVIHRNDEGYLVDIQTMDSETAAGNVNAGGGVVEVGGSSTYGSSSRVRFQTDHDAMMAFQQTGILPGAIDNLGHDDPRRGLYERAVNDPESLTSRDKAMLVVMARELNARTMAHDPSGLSLPYGGEGTEYTQVEQGKNSMSETHLNVGGFNILDSGYGEQRSSKVARDPSGQIVPTETRGDDSNYYFSADDHSRHVAGGGGSVLYSESTTNLGSGERVDLYKGAGDSAATETRYGSGGVGSGASYSYQALRGNKDQITISINEDQRQRLAPELDYEGGSLVWRGDAIDNERRMATITSVMKEGTSPDQVLHQLVLYGLQANRPQLKDPRDQNTLLVKDFFSPKGQNGRGRNPLLDYHDQWMAHEGKIGAASEGALGTKPQKFDRAQGFVDQLNPQFVDQTRSNIATDQLLEIANQSGSLQRNTRIGAVESLDDLRALPASEQKQWLRRASARDMSMVLAIDDPVMRTRTLTHFIERSEMGKKGSQFSLEFAEELMGLVQEDSPEEFKRLIIEILEIERVQGR